MWSRAQHLGTNISCALFRKQTRWEYKHNIAKEHPTNNCNRMITTERSIQADYTAPLPAIHMTQHQSLLLLQNRPIRQSAHCQCYWQKGWAPPEIHSRNRIWVKDMCCKKINGFITRHKYMVWYLLCINPNKKTSRLFQMGWEEERIYFKL